MGTAFSQAATEAAKNPEVQKLAISGMSLMFEGLKSLFSSNTDYVKGVQKLEKDVNTLYELTQKEREQYEKVKKYMDKKKIYVTGKHNDSYTIIGAKGSGKSTFLWLRYGIAKPVLAPDQIGDGTQVNQYYNQNGEIAVDTIGVYLTYESILKIIATLLDNLPNTLIVSCNNHQFKMASLTLRFLSITDYYVLNLFANESHRKGEAVYDEHFYQVIRNLNSSIKPIKHGDVLERVDSLGGLRKLFVGDLIVLPEWDDYRGTSDSTDLTRYLLCKYYYEYKTKYNSDGLRFLNTIH